MAARITPVILAGGSGSRLWPVSRDAFPKQFQPLVADLSTYQQTLKRVAPGELFNAPVVVTSDEFRFFARRQAQDIGIDPAVVLEPARRDSAAAMAAAAVYAEHRDPGGLVMSLAADHVVLDDNLFRDSVARGVAAAEAGRIVVFGLVPSEPKTAYGYIRPGAPLADDADVCSVEAFVEKPDQATAIRYCTDGYLWNSGNFLFRSDVMIAEFAAHAPDVLEAAEAAVARGVEDFGFWRLDRASFSTARRTSIDYAVIEKTKAIAVVKGRFRWSDVGAWDAIWQVGEKDDAGNVLRGDAMTIGASNCLVHSDGLMTAVIGAEDLVVVSTADAVLVVPKARAQEVKTLVDRLKASGRRETGVHRRDYRYWGHVEMLDEAERFVVKRVVVDPGAEMSLQRHLHRSEHWIVVRGTASVVLDGEAERIVSENESIYVPLGTAHRLANRGRIPLEIIEVRTGSYLGDDDVIRIAGAGPSRA